MDISVILPIYKVENYIESSIKSICTQSYSGCYEVILVDDCSPDSSVARAEKVLLEYSNRGIRKFEYRIIYHEKNRGLSAARNTGLAEAKGEYVYFLDSDDLVTPDCLENLWSLAQQHPDAEMIVGQYDEYEEGEVYHEARWKQVGGVYTGDVIGAYLDKRIPVTSWNKMTKRNFLLENNLRFEEGLIHEDYLWSFQCACLMREVIVSDRVTYHYLQRSNSIMSGNDFVKHQSFYAKGNALQTKFVFEHGLQKDIRIFRYIDQYRRNIIGDLSGRNAKGDITDILYIFKNIPYWNIWSINKYGGTLREVLRRLLKPNWR